MKNFTLPLFLSTALLTVAFSAAALASGMTDAQGPTAAPTQDQGVTLGGNHYGLNTRQLFPIIIT